jgi:hypothetical protein
VLERDIFYFAKKHSDSTKKKTDIINMLEFLVDNIFVIFGGMFFNRQSACIWVQTVLLFPRTCFLLASGRLHTEKVEKSNVLMLLQEEGDLDCMYSHRSLEVFRIHI